MTPEEARRAAYAEFLTQWGTTTPVRLEFAEEGLAEPVPGTTWVRLALRHYGGGQLTLGPTLGRKYRRLGAVLAQVFTPLTQRGRGATLGHAVRAIFEGRTVGGLQFNDGQVTEIPLDEGEKNYQTNVEVRFTYDETK